MADKYVFENEDSDDQKAEEEEQTTLAARDTWVSSVLKFPFFIVGPLPRVRPRNGILALLFFHLGLSS